MYITHMPYAEMRQVCCIIDQTNKWEELALTHMQFDFMTVEKLKRLYALGKSPSEELLILWGDQNHKVIELFVLLSRMKLYQAMVPLKALVETKYHKLIKHNAVNNNNNNGNRPTIDQVNHLIRHFEIKPLNDSKISQGNMNISSEKIINTPKIMLSTKQVVNSNENNISDQQKILEMIKPKSPLPHLLNNRLGNSRLFTVTDISSVVGSAGVTPQILYEELARSTSNWDPKNIIGKGGFGTVYKGNWKCTQVAIKRLEHKSDKPDMQSEQIKQSITELHCLNAYRHDNILPLYGYSMDGQHPCLIYQYMPGGSLDHRLRSIDSTKWLQWPARLHIAIGVARGLQFLHTTLNGEKPLVHGDIKSANILLDPSDQPRIGDFGLAKEGPQSNLNYLKVTKIHGTRAYLPDEFIKGKQFSTKVDTYCFGIVLFEIGTTLSAYTSERSEKFLRDHVVNYKGNILELKDKRVRGYDNYYLGLIEIGKNCVSQNAKDRPDMVRVLISLEEVLEREKSTDG